MRSIKTKIGIVLGIVIIASVAMMMGIPFMDSSLNLQKIQNASIKKLDAPEDKMLDLISHEKAELSSKIGGKILP